MSGPAAPALHVIVLAAGAATRFGAPKQLALLGGKPLLHHAIERSLEVAGASTLLVLGCGAREAASALPSGAFNTVINAQWQEGIASSIRAGVTQLPGDCAGALLLLADQPCITRESLLRLVVAWRSRPHYIVASRYRDTTGSPCIFPSWCFGNLRSLRGDQGARLLLHRYPERLIAIAHPEAATDIDTVDELAALQGSLGPSGDR